MVVVALLSARLCLCAHGVRQTAINAAHSASLPAVSGLLGNGQQLAETASHYGEILRPAVGAPGSFARGLMEFHCAARNDFQLKYLGVSR